MKKSLSVIIAIMTILSTVAIMPVMSVSADSYKYPVINTAIKVKGKENSCGRITQSTDHKKLYATAKGKKSVVISKDKKISGAVLRGKTVFYTFKNGSYCYFSSSPLTGVGKKVIYKRKVDKNDNFSLIAVTGNTAIIRGDYIYGSVIYKYDIVKKKFRNLSGEKTTVGENVNAFAGRVFYFDKFEQSLNIVVIANGAKVSYKGMEMGKFTDNYRVYKNSKGIFKVDRNYISHKLDMPADTYYSNYFVSGNTVYLEYGFKNNDAAKYAKIAGYNKYQYLGTYKDLGIEERIKDIFAKNGKTYYIVETMGKLEKKEKFTHILNLYQTDSNLKGGKKIYTCESYDLLGGYAGFDVIGSTCYLASENDNTLNIRRKVLK